MSRISRLPLKALHYFEAVCRRRHIGKASEELGVSYGAVGRHIRNLEAHFDAKLFTRENGQLQMTAAGARLFEAVREGLDCIERGAQHLNPEKLAGKLSIGCTPTIGSTWAARRICTFAETYPQIEIHVSNIEPAQTSIPHHLEIALCYGKPAATGRALHELYTPQIYPLCSASYAHRHQQAIHNRSFQGMTLLHDRQNSWRRWFELAKKPYPEDARHIHFESTLIALNAARLGFGAVLCNMLEIEEYVRDGALTQISSKGMPEAHRYYLISDKPEEQSLRARLFEEWMVRSMPQQDGRD